MLAAAQRLRRSSDFAAAVRGGRRAGRGALVVHLTVPGTTGSDNAAPKPARDGAEADSTPVSRAGFVVSKAVGPAVVRNRVRRRLRHLTRERLVDLPAGSTLVVRALPAAADATYQRLGADLEAALDAARSGRTRRPR
ncbi:MULTISPECIES: ribonuclease P protein component [unclassified Micromonospora]|uniref:ribonuclease P protein component n=1 Tax=unclassified Micromonospora TaxID=2617518 RepID=UPI0022B723C8|nr:MULTISPECIES: ribonuclease P protein component [unclassified Micromonospora]MCZ7421756.1 ribonuclease P protein component [Verrucosispora sp. WMMA2121]WBB93573.1 ribonuclease P protein component [Verrucosispora sp. WMMC514]